MKPFSETEYGTKLKSNECYFLDLLFNFNSELNKEQSFQARLEEACEKTNMNPLTVLNDMQEHIHYYLSYYQYNNKYQLLIGKQIMFWNVQKETLKDIKQEDVSEELAKMNKLSDLGDKLEESIEKLYQELYVEQVIGGAKEEVKKALSPEQRLKERKGK